MSAELTPGWAPNQCEFCYEPHRFKVTGRWSVVDWLDVYACEKHAVDAILYLRGRTVDGQQVQELETQLVLVID